MKKALTMASIHKIYEYLSTISKPNINKENFENMVNIDQVTNNHQNMNIHQKMNVKNANTW